MLPRLIYWRFLFSLQLSLLHQTMQIRNSHLNWNNTTLDRFWMRFSNALNSREREYLRKARKCYLAINVFQINRSFITQRPKNLIDYFDIKAVFIKSQISFFFSNGNWPTDCAEWEALTGNRLLSHFPLISCVIDSIFQQRNILRNSALKTCF